MALNARKHTIPAGTETSVNRATIFETFGNSIHDVVPVANTTERAQLVTALTDAGEEPSASSPLVVLRADAPGLHRLEYTTDGLVWLPGSGRLQFSSDAERDTWTTSNAALLAVGDTCVSNGTRCIWSGSAWLGSGWTTLAATNDWTANTGSVSPQVSRDGYMVSYRGGMYGGTSSNAAATLPDWAWPKRDTRLPVIMSDNSTIGRCRISPTGGLFFSGAISQDAAITWSVT